jgi:multidrug efflux pump subunit AcrB
MGALGRRRGRRDARAERADRGRAARRTTDRDQAFQPNLTFLGRLEEPEAFGEIIVRATPDGRILRLRDVARIELGALSYATNSYLQRKPAVALAVSQRPGSNALATADRIRATMRTIAAEFPPGLAYDIAYDPRASSPRACPS